MKTTPIGDEHEIYRAVTKGELFWCAYALYQLRKGEDSSLSGFKAFIKAEARLWLKLDYEED